MSLALYFALCVVVSAIVIRFSMTLAGRFGVLDHPGGHKQHDTSTPFVGGFGVVAVVLVALFLGSIYFPRLPLRSIQTVAAGAWRIIRYRVCRRPVASPFQDTLCHPGDGCYGHGVPGRC